MFGKKARRLLLCGSLYGKMVDSEDIRASENLNLINDKLKLAYNPHAIEFPAVINGFLARKFDIDRKTILDTITKGNKDELRALAEQICTKVPSYMRYSTEDMCNDITTLFSLGIKSPHAA